MLLTGLVFVGGLIIIFPQYAIQLIQSDFYEKLKTGPEVILTICIFAIAYEIGLIINRIGSVIIEPFLKRFKLIPFNDDYTLFNDKKKDYPILGTLSREFALSRTSIALFLLLSIVSIYNRNCVVFISCVVISIVFYLSCRKHSSKIVQLMDKPKESAIKK